MFNYYWSHWLTVLMHLLINACLSGQMFIALLISMGLWFEYSITGKPSNNNCSTSVPTLAENINQNSLVLPFHMHFKLCFSIEESMQFIQQKQNIMDPSNSSDMQFKATEDYALNFAFFSRFFFFFFSLSIILKKHNNTTMIQNSGHWRKYFSQRLRVKKTNLAWD